MLRRTVMAPAMAGVLSLAASAARAETVMQDFAGDPLTNGWAIFGDAALFAWDVTNQNLRVTWDSTHTNSYFWHPLGLSVTRRDDFQIGFDLRMDDCLSGHEADKTGPLQIGIGLINFAGATSASFGRGLFGSAPNLAEFNYFPYGYYESGGDIFPSDPTSVFDFVSSSGFAYSPTYFAPLYEFELPTNQVVQVAIQYTARNQHLAMTLTTNGVVCFQPPDVVLDGPASGFTSADDFVADAFSISSYSSFGDSYNSVLGHGVVDNVYVHVPPVQDLNGDFSNQVWRAQFRSRTNWLYTLERTVNFANWTNVSATLPGNAGDLLLQDTNAPAGGAFYRVRADRP